MDGILNIYKEPGFTSHDVVAKLRGILRQKKIGHTGTLDPDARGVLPVCLGKATKLCALLTDEGKEYEAVLLLGRTTDTQDASGTTLREDPEGAGRLSEEEVRACIRSFVGEQEQIPPMYSALKVNGRKLYELAREGIEVERKARKVHFYEIQVLGAELPRVRIRVRCSKGTYIRTLCHDIGEKLGCGGCMEELLRTRVGRFCIEDALTLGEVEALAHQGRAEECLVSVEEMFDTLPRAQCDPAADRLLANGNPVPLRQAAAESDEDGAQVRMYDSTGRFIGIFAVERAQGRLKPVKMF